MSGHIEISRQMLSHPLVGIQNPKYFTAWAWMISEARYKPGRIFASGTVIELRRGQFSHSLRFMADVLPLSVQELRTFLKHLKNQHMIQHDINTGQNVITICNYDKYQLKPGYSNTASTQEATQDQHGSNTASTQRRIPEVIPEEIPSVVVARAREDDPEAIHESCLELIGVSRETHMAFASSMHVRKWLKAGCETEDIFEGVKRGLASLHGEPPGSMAYFDKPVMNAKATRERPLPEGKARASPKESPHEQLFRVAETLYNEYAEEENGEPTRPQASNVRLIESESG